MAEPSKADQKILDEAQERFKRCKDWEATARTRSVADTKFCEGDSDNNWQWDDVMVNRRMNDPNGPRPTLTINKTRQHCLQIVNDARQNKAQIEIRAVGDGATYEAAKVFEGVVRHIEYISNAPEIYDSATWQQVTGGWGYWRVVTDYVDDKSFDQEIYLRRVPDRLSVYLDPDIQEFDGSDARFGFVFQDVARDKFEVDYPDLKDEDDRDGYGDTPLDASPDAWDAKDHVRVAEYYRKSDKTERLYALDPDFYAMLVQGGYIVPGDYPPPIICETQLPKGMSVKDFPDGAIKSSRETNKVKVEWFKIVGRRIVDRKDWLGIYIPLVRVVGEETIIQGQLDRKGHTRALKDAQRMYNFWTSGAAEHVALQTKIPYVTPALAVQGLETFWDKANTENFAYLPYNHVGENGEPIPPPQRSPPPAMSSAYMQGMQTAQTELMMASGQWQAQMGQNENAKSGIAIQERQRQGDNATYHYIDHLAQAIRFTGRILIDLIPKIYDTPRVIKIMAEDGDQSEVHIDPDAPLPHAQMIGTQLANAQQVKEAQGNPDMADQVKSIFNPSVGKYDVVADVGPGYATRRQEAFNALTQMMSQNQELVKIAGDILFRVADFPMADELAERFKRTIAPAILGEGPPPALAQAEQQFQAQLGGMQKVLQKLLQDNATQSLQLQKHDQQASTDAYRAETDRLAALAKADPELIKPLVDALISRSIGMPALPAAAAHAEAAQEMMPEPPEQEQEPTDQAEQAA